MLNSGVIATFKREATGYSLDTLSQFTDSSGIRVLDERIIRDNFEFPFYKLAQNTPYRTIIYDESFTKGGADLYFDREMANTWISLARIYKAAIAKGYSITPRISYNKCFVSNLFYINDNGVDYLFFDKYSDIDDHIVKDVSNGADYLIYYPIIFKKTNSGYYSICPPNSFNRIISGKNLPIFYDRGDGYKVYRIEVYNFDEAINGLPVFELSKGKQIPNIIPDKFNLDRW